LSLELTPASELLKMLKYQMMKIGSCFEDKGGKTRENPRTANAVPRFVELTSPTNIFPSLANRINSRKGAEFRLCRRRAQVPPECAGSSFLLQSRSDPRLRCLSIFSNITPCWGSGSSTPHLFRTCPNLGQPVRYPLQEEPAPAIKSTGRPL
jgi:hypothetical protein